MEKITISLKDFLLTGNFGPVCIGMTKNEIICFLGKPAEDHNFSGGSSVLFYNGFEFFYYTENGQCFAIQNDSIGNLFADSETYEINRKTAVDLSFLCFGKVLNFGNLKDYLVQEQIPFEIIRKEDYDEIAFESGVKFDFKNRDENTAEDQLLLNGIRLFSY